MLYESLVSALQGLGIPFAEYGWDHSPPAPYGVIFPEAEKSLGADNLHTETALQGSIDLYVASTASASLLVPQIKAILDGVGAWHLNPIQIEESPRLLHYEFVFELEGC